MRRNLLTAGAVALGLGLILAGCAGQGTATSDSGGEPASRNDPPTGDADMPGDAPASYDPGTAMSLSATQAEPVRGNDAWCGTMQLCWNELMDEYNSGKPVEFKDPVRQTAEIDRMNQRLFTTDDLRGDHYYTYAGPMTLEAKSQIENGIADKFGQSSDILDQFVGWGDADAKFLYAMLYRRFSFATPFAVNDRPGYFGSDDNGNRTEGVAYFNADTDEQRSQVHPLYYDDNDHHAVRIDTAEGDVITLVKNPTGDTLGAMWDDAMRRAEGADAESVRPLDDEDKFACPNLEIDLMRSYDEWTGSPLSLTDADGFVIGQAMQTLKLHLDNEGGEVKSEAGMSLLKSAAPPSDGPAPRRFCYDDTFVMFVSDGEAPNKGTQPYVGVLVNDISQFQGGTAE